ncbi:unnamed protein product, partial [Polarella glacialis]
MVHRLGDWLVIDDGSELTACLGSGVGNSEGDDAERRRLAARRHSAALAQAQVSESKSVEAQQRAEEARAALWAAEMASKRAQDELHEALMEVQRAAEERDRLGAAEGRASAGSRGDGSRNARTVGVRMQTRPVGSCRPATVTQETHGELPSEVQLYHNFLGHSIQLIQEEQTPLQTPSDREVSARSGGQLVAMDSPPAAFGQVGVWKIADDASVVIGSRMLCLGNSEHPKLTLYLHNDNVISDMMLLEYWLECLMAGVPEFAICFHRDGAVQSYSLYNVSELRHFLEERMKIERKLKMTLEILRWIKRQCRLEGCTYWLSKAKNQPTLRLCKLSGPGTSESERRGEAPLPASELSGLSATLGAELVLKNTFLHVPEAEIYSVFRRALSCPARIFGSSDLSAEQAEQQESVSQPLRGRVSALFFRRAVASMPGPDAARFFRHALDLQALSSSASATGGASAAEDETDRPVSPSSATSFTSAGGGGGRIPLQACSHLGLALCELLPRGHKYPGHEGRESAAGPDQEPQSASAALLAALRRDASASPLRGAESGAGPSLGYRLLPLWGSRRGAAAFRLHAPLLFVGAPPWPRGLTTSFSSVGAGGAADFPSGRTAAAANNNNSNSNSNSNSSNSKRDGLAALLTSAMASVSRVGDALGLIGSDGLPEDDRRRLEAIACPTAALSMLRLASVLRQTTCPQRWGSASSNNNDNNNKNNNKNNNLPGAKSVQDLIWRALVAGRGFSALDAARQPRPEPQPIFSQLPTSDELLVRVEHLCGSFLLSGVSASSVPQVKAGARRSGAAAAQEGCKQDLDELDRRLT